MMQYYSSLIKTTQKFSCKKCNNTLSLLLSVIPSTGGDSVVKNMVKQPNSNLRKKNHYD